MTSYMRIADDGTIKATNDAINAIGEERLDAWVRWAVGAEADSFVDFVKANYLSGQKLNVVSGETRSHVGAWMQRKFRGKRMSVHVIRPGKGIPGLQNYLERWTGTKHEFMRPAFAAFGSEVRIANAIDRNIVSQLRKVEREN